MKIINNKEEFVNYYPYQNKSFIKKYPDEYPCVAKIEFENFGIMGDGQVVYVTYIPKNLTPMEAFIAGLDCEWIKC